MVCPQLTPVHATTGLCTGEVGGALRIRLQGGREEDGKVEVSMAVGRGG